jgi:ribosomal protein S3
MARKINPIIVRIPFLKTWPSLWHGDFVYSNLLLADLFIKKYIKTEFRHYGVDVFECFIKRNFNRTFIVVYIFNTNSRANLQFKPFLFLRSFKLFRVVFDQEVSRLSQSLAKFLGSGLIHFNLRFIKYQKTNLKAIALSANPILLANYFARKYKRMNSVRFLFKSLKRIYSVLARKQFNFKGLKIRVAGPVRAPRTRRSLVFRKVFFGTTPIQTFANQISYVVRTRALSEGVVTAKFWMLKKLSARKLFDNSLFFTYMRKILVAYKRFTLMKVPRAKRPVGIKYWKAFNSRFHRIYRKRNTNKYVRE